MSRIIDNETGTVYEDPTMNAVPPNQPATPNAKEIAAFTGAPLKWVLIAGLLLMVLPPLFKKR